jgi:SAM-dependent methyltransferase
MEIQLTLSKILLVFLILAALNYVAIILLQKLQPEPIIGPGMYPQKEGFTDTQQGEIFLSNDKLYDKFYASVYDMLTQQNTRTAAKVAMIFQEWQKKGWKAEEMEILDAGCGTGVASAAFAKMKVKRVLALDKSEAMMEKAKFGNQKNPTVDYRLADLQNPSALTGGEVTHAACLYFSLYYLPDKEAFFRNLFLWVKPGGELAIEVVNKYKFDPMLESAAPWVGFSLQKYSKKRVTESNVTFDKFVYSGKFDLYDPNAEFTETFRFKNGTVRRQKHKLTMPTMEEIVKIGQAAGWTYTKYLDLVMVGFEYSYLLFFRHP